MLEYVNGYAMPAPKGICSCGCGEQIKREEGYTYRSWESTGYVYVFKLNGHIDRWLRERIREVKP